MPKLALTTKKIESPFIKWWDSLKSYFNLQDVAKLRASSKELMNFIDSEVGFLTSDDIKNVKSNLDMTGLYSLLEALKLKSSSQSDKTFTFGDVFNKVKVKETSKWIHPDTMAPTFDPLMQEIDLSELKKAITFDKLPEFRKAYRFLDTRDKRHKFIMSWLENKGEPLFIQHQSLSDLTRLSQSLSRYENSEVIADLQAKTEQAILQQKGKLKTQETKALSL